MRENLLFAKEIITGTIKQRACELAHSANRAITYKAGFGGRMMNEFELITKKLITLIKYSSIIERKFT